MNIPCPPEIKKVLSMKVSVPLMICVAIGAYGGAQVHQELVRYRDSVDRNTRVILRVENKVDSVAAMLGGVHEEIHQIHDHE